MLRKFSGACAFVLAVAMVAGQASANLLLSARAAGGANNVELQFGQEIELTITATAQTAFLLYNGGDFTINSGSSATFQAATYLLTGAGGWTAVPPQGGPSRFFTGGPAATHIFFNAGDSLNLGRIVMRAGNTQGSFSTSFSDVAQLDSAFLPIPTQTSGFSYSVVPEPSSAMLLSLAASGLAFFRRRS